MGTDDLHSVATLLMENAELVRNKERFYNSLGLPHGELLDLEKRAFITGSDSYGFFISTLKKWIALNGNNAELNVLVTTLNNEGFKYSADALSKWKPSTSSTSARGSDNGTPLLPPSGWLYQDGQFNLFEISKLYPRTQSGQLLTETIANLIAADSNSTLVISGPGGYGKTSLTLSYALAYVDSGEYAHVVWFECKDLYTFESSVKGIAEKLETALRFPQTLKPKPVGYIVEEIYTRLENRKCLLIFENVASDSESFLQIRLFLPRSQRNFHVLLTSSGQGIDQFTNFKLNVFTREEAFKILCQELQIGPNQVEVETLVSSLAEKLGFVPVGLDLLLGQGLPAIRDHFENIELEVPPSELLAKYLPEYPEVLYTIFVASLTQLLSSQLRAAGHVSADLTRNLLFLFAFVDLDDLTSEIVHNSVTLAHNENLVLYSLQVLERHRFIKKIPTLQAQSQNRAHLYKISQVWQKILQIRLMSLPRREIVDILKFGITTTAAASRPTAATSFLCIRQNFWEFLTIKTNLLFESFEIVEVCRKQKYFEPNFCLQCIQAESDRADATAKILKIKLFTIYLNVWLWTRTICVSLFCGVLIASLGLFPLELALGYFFSVLFRWVALGFVTSLLICLAIPFSVFHRTRTFRAVTFIIFVTGLAITIISLALSPFTLKFDYAQWIRQKILQVFWSLAGMTLCYCSIFALQQRQHRSMKFWQYALILFFLTLGMSNYLYALASLIFGVVQDQMLKRDDAGYSGDEPRGMPTIFDITGIVLYIAGALLAFAHYRIHICVQAKTLKDSHGRGMVAA